jgi:hypothetical protein
MPTYSLRVQNAQVQKRLDSWSNTWRISRSMRLSSNIEALFMDGGARTFIKELTIRTGQYYSSRFNMETALVVSPHSHGMIGILTTSSATTTRFSSISPAPANSPPNTLEEISTAIRIWVLHLVEVCGN